MDGDKDGQVFVYGTLKTGQERERQWPVPPLAVRRAWTLGRLYDLGPYPALIPGDDRVLGELWTIAAASIAETISVLDEIEGTNQAGLANEYDRVAVEVFLPDGAQERALIYHFAQHSLLTSATYLAPSIALDEHLRPVDLAEGAGLFSVWPRQVKAAKES